MPTKLYPPLRVTGTCFESVAAIAQYRSLLAGAGLLQQPSPNSSFRARLSGRQEPLCVGNSSNLVFANLWLIFNLFSRFYIKVHMAIFNSFPVGSLLKTKLVQLSVPPVVYLCRCQSPLAAPSSSQNSSFRARLSGRQEALCVGNYKDCPNNILGSLL